MSEIKFFSTTADVDRLIEESFDKPIGIFKHSTTCPISSMAKMRLSGAIDGNAYQIETYLLDLLSNRATSNYIAERLQVRHESPQLIVIHKGEVVYHGSHLDIQPEEIKL